MYYDARVTYCSFNVLELDVACFANFELLAVNDVTFEVRSCLDVIAVDFHAEPEVFGWVIEL